MASLTGNLVAETYKALLKTIDNDILTASEKQITDGLGGGSNVFIDSQGFLRANKYKVTNGLATQFLKADGSLDANAYLTSITGAQVITALGYTPVTNQRTLTINGVTYNLTADRSWTVEGTVAVWGNITGTLSNQTDLQNALNAKYDDPTGTISQYIRGDGSIADFPAVTGFVPYTGATEDVDLGDFALFAHDLEIDHGSSSGTAVNIIKGGSGIAVNITKTGSGEALTVVKSSGSGNAASITGGVTLISELHLTTALADAYIASAATWNAKIGGSGTTNYIPKFTAASFLGNSNIQDSGTLITLGSNSTVIGDLSVSKNDRANGAVLTLTNSFNGTGWIAGDIIGSLLFYSSDTSFPANRGAIRSISESGSTNSSQTGLSFETYSSATLSQKMYLNGLGSLGIGTTSLGGYNLRISKNITGTTNSFGVVVDGIIQSGVTTQANYFRSTASTQDASFTLPTLSHYVAAQGTFGASSIITNQIGFNVGSTLTGATNNYGFYGNIASGEGRWNIYMNGTANNYLNGKLLIGTIVDAGYKLDVSGTGRLTGNLTASAFVKEGGTSVEYLKADGSTVTITGEIISGSGTAGYIPKFSSSIVLGNSLLYDNGTSLAIGTSTLNYGGYGRTLTGAAFASTSFGFEAVTGSTTDGNLIGGLSLVIANNDSSRRIGSQIQSYISGATATNQGADMRFYVKPDAGVLLEIVRMTSAGITFNKDLTATNITATAFIKSGGLSNEFLMADGSVTTYTNPVTGTGSAGYIPKWTTSANIGSSLIYEDGTSIGIAYTTPNKGGYGRTLTGASFGSASFGFEAVSNTTTNGGLIGGLSFIVNQNDSSRIVGSAIQSNLVGTTATNYGADLRFFAKADGVFTIAEVARMTSAGLRVYGTIIKDGGTASQFLKADGSVDSTTYTPTSRTLTINGTSYDLSANRSWTISTGVSGSGTTNYLPKWTSASGLGNSVIYDNGTSVGINTNTPLSLMNNTGLQINRGGHSTLLIGDGINYGGVVQSSDDIKRVFIGANIYDDSANAWSQFSNTSGYAAFDAISESDGGLIRCLVGSGNDSGYSGANIFLEAYKNNSNSYFKIRTNTDNAIYISNSGNVGLNTSTDSGYKLDVNGTARIQSRTTISTSLGSSSDWALGVTNSNSTSFYVANGAGYGFYLDAGSIASSSTYVASFVSNGVSRLFVRGDGYIGINTGSPSAFLHINESSYGTGLLITTSSASGADITLTNTGAGGKRWDITSGGSNNGIGAGGLQFYNNTDGAMRMGISSAGNVLIGTTTDAGYPLLIGKGRDGWQTAFVNSSSYGTTNIFFGHGEGYGAYIDSGHHGNSTARYIFKLVSGGTERVVVRGDGLATFSSSITATAFFESSDFRLKTLIESNPIIDGIEKLEAKLYEKNGKIELGYFAQDAEKIMPYAVTKNDEGFLNLSYREVHTAKIARLEKEVAELKAQLNLN